MVKVNSEEFSQDNIPKSNWFNFIEIGNSIKGTLVTSFDKKGTGSLPDQRVYVLNNTIIN
jgi:hypothetical protein